MGREGESKRVRARGKHIAQGIGIGAAMERQPRPGGDNDYIPLRRWIGRVLYPVFFLWLGFALWVLDLPPITFAVVFIYLSAFAMFTWVLTESWLNDEERRPWRDR